MTIEERLTEIEAEVGRGNFDLTGLGFWEVVERVKRDSNLVDKFAGRIGEIDARAFRGTSWVYFDVPTGNFLALIVAALGSAWLRLALAFGVGHLSMVLLTLGVAAITIALHPVAHYIAGKKLGIEFLFYFPDGPLGFQPTLKSDYKSYLSAPPRNRALMHLAGAISTPIVPLFVLAIALLLNVSPTYLKIISAAFVLALALEVTPLAALKLGYNKNFVRKTDIYRVFRELSYV
ncbi:MAG: hypothetical protein V3V92_03310 [Candidatus Hydrothermarchaeales archaeon]